MLVSTLNGIINGCEAVSTQPYYSTKAQQRATASGIGQRKEMMMDCERTERTWWTCLAMTSHWKGSLLQWLNMSLVHYSHLHAWQQTWPISSHNFTFLTPHLHMIPHLLSWTCARGKLFVQVFPSYSEKMQVIPNTDSRLCFIICSVILHLATC